MTTTTTAAAGHKCISMLKKYVCRLLYKLNTLLICFASVFPFCQIVFFFFFFLNLLICLLLLRVGIYLLLYKIYIVFSLLILHFESMFYTCIK
ncbi:uncharacterized protein Dmoj_GI26984 [Drosophila mojavensis]|uniref:Uncharacterized protein n=1 Tax=Drosophila mojavensis TaxID=7230 RepID=A0A0Q9X8T8_DROMO|nr:uncharacterized protein Dmoj_GI26984 [Drosophila mojavensis]